MHIRTLPNLLLLTLLFSATALQGQMMGFDEIDDSKVSPWIPKFTIEYGGVYHFGDSELESNFILILGLADCYAQIESSNWSEDGRAWIQTYKNLTNVRIEGNKFYSDETDGEFVIYEGDQGRLKGLKVFNPWSGVTDEGQYEVGPTSYALGDYFSGKFPHASSRMLVEAELLDLPKSELKIMRNEIFARYGYKFKPGGKMDSYFRQQGWYLAQHDDVNDFLTGIEKANIKLIRSLESR